MVDADLSRLPNASPKVDRIRAHARLLGFGVFAAISFAWFAGTWLDPFHRHAGGVGDPELYLFTLAWPPFAIAHHMNPLYTTYIAAPHGANLMWSIPPGFGVALLPLTVVLGPVFTYNLLATLSLAFSAWCTQLSLRRFVDGEMGPFVGGLFYGFSPYMTAHSLGHAMLTVAVMPPLTLLLLHEALIRQRWHPAKVGLVTGALIAAQLSTFLEMLAGTAIASAVVVVALAVAYRRDIGARARYVAIVAGSTVASTLVLAGYQMRTLFFGTGNLLASGPIHPSDVFVNDLLNFAVPTKLMALAPSAATTLASSFTGNEAESNAYLGLPLLLILALIVVRWRRIPLVKITLLSTAVMAVLSLGPNLHVGGVSYSFLPLPWGLFAKLPLLGNLLPSRLAVFADLGVALLIAYGISRAEPNRWVVRTALRVVLIGAVVLTLAPSPTLPFQTTDVAIPHYFQSADVQRIPDGSIVMTAPWTSSVPMVWLAASNFRFRMASGYAYVPGKNGTLSVPNDDLLEYDVAAVGEGKSIPPLDAATRANLLNLMHSHNITTVLVGPMANQGQTLAFLTDLLGRAPSLSGDVYAWYGVDRADTPGPPG